MKLLRES
jgi:hypothetical protein